MMNPKIASALRWALVLVAGFLVARGRLARGQEETFADAAVEIISGGAALYALLWGQRYHGGVGEVVRTALALPSHATPLDLKAAPKLGGFADLLVRQALSTVVEIVADRVRRGQFAGALVNLRDSLNEAFPPGE